MEEMKRCGYCKIEVLMSDYFHGVCRSCENNAKQLQRDKKINSYHGVTDPAYKTRYLYEFKGDQCWYCGFDKNSKALILTHKDTFKSLGIKDKICLKMERLLDLIRDYRLCCRNCHSILS